MVCISKHPQTVRLIRATPHSYFRVLREKLKWAER
jgi:NAD kinase